MSKTLKSALSTTLAVTLLLIGTSAAAMKSQPGLPVKKIKFANQIETWEVIDRQHLLVSLSATRNYLLKLRQNCRSLNASSHLGISSSNNTVYAGFDYITANGQRCSIQSINKLSKAELASLKG